VSGRGVSSTTAKVDVYSEGVRQGPNSSLTIKMAKPLRDEEIENLAAYLEDVKWKVE
jgi:hypothetical protein